ncbi:3714_t:CDS:2, partial [Scutellospora calospora]
PKLGLNKIAAYVGCGKVTVDRWLCRYYQTKDLNSKKRPGPKRATTTTQDRKIQGINISARTIRRHLVEAGGHFASGLSKLLLTAKHQIKRLNINKGCSSSKNIEKYFVLLSILRRCMCRAVFLVRGLKFFGEDNKSWILQEDNDPKHRSIIAKD